jgi:hypothetical protein
VYDSAHCRLPANPVLRFIAILNAARAFGVAERDIERIARRFDPHQPRLRELADALADTLVTRRNLAVNEFYPG